MEVRNAAEGQRELRMGSALHPPPRTERHGGLRASKRLYELEPVRRGRDKEEHHRGRPGGLHGGITRAALLLDADTGMSLVHPARQEERTLSRPQRRDAV